MSENDEKAPPRVTCELSGEAMAKITDLLPAVAHWAASMGQPRTSPADVVELAIALLHEQVFDKAEAMIRDGKVRKQASQATDDAIRKALAASPKH